MNLLTLIYFSVFMPYLVYLELWFYWLVSNSVGVHVRFYHLIRKSEFELLINVFLMIPSVLWCTRHLADFRPMLILVLLFPLFLRHDNCRHNRDDHSDCNDQDSNHLCNTELNRFKHSVVSVKFVVKWVASEAVVVIQKQPFDVTELLENSLKITVTPPGVSSQHYVSAVRIETQEGLELNRGQVVVAEVQFSKAGQWWKYSDVQAMYLVVMQI